ncbi:hypothetical protein BKH42_08375 [Helicobacter sp. 13S00482-2]|uniref:CCA tRNA nucleotidyltransferase n=1 Tax=Helicobacter sp. 13S00482-2 TaxID=1476200 RepID=UPI000BA5E4D0|nr:CCA tRNA nucleotidyltransferase [Helicobacter sp. 13S00482-2]PAF52975.1 hypothetical protein BKH42_08375 [Helicobacter sp. 13S00482-2]
MFVISLPKEVTQIIAMIENNGFEAYVVGGCVRDSMMNSIELSVLHPNDWDITTSAKPDEVIEILENAGIKTIPTGIKHGTVTAIIAKERYEITTYRTEGKYLNHRIPAEVKFVSTLKDDLSRRDFTINAMAYHPAMGIIDIYGGIKHLKHKIICAVGNPDERFKEDALRILRALRFAARFGFKIAEQTSEAIFTHKKLLGFISVHRKIQEIKSLICADFAFDVLRQYREVILFTLLGEDGNYPDYEYAIKIIPYCPKNPTTRLIVLFYFTIKDKLQIEKILQTFLLPKWMQKMILDMMKYLDQTPIDDKLWIKQCLSVMGEKNFRIFLEIKNAQIKQKKLSFEANTLSGIFEKFQNIIENKEPICIKDLALNGDDLQRLGIPKGKQIKEMFHKILQVVLSEKIPNDKEALKEFVCENK